VTDRAEIVVPASIGNVGSGFDALSVAVQLYLRVRILDVSPSAPDRLETEFRGPFPAPIGEDGIERAFRHARAKTGVAAPGVRVEVRSDIPIRAGLGSSAAAAIAGVRLYAAVTSALSRDDILSMGCELEGHPDNAAACLLGGLTVSCRQDDGRILAHASPWPASLRFVIATPDVALATKDARSVLPSSVPLADAVFNLQRALLLVRAAEHERHDDLKEAFRDRWHQPARSALVPGLREALAIDHPAILGVCLSGSGPSIAAVSAPGRETEAAGILGDVYRRLDLSHTIRIVAAHQPIGTGLQPLAIEREHTA
jgi:homoserine kinase